MALGLTAVISMILLPLQDCFELGVILTRKRLYTQATKNLEKAKKIWDGEESELAQVSYIIYMHAGCPDVIIAPASLALALAPHYLIMCLSLWTSGFHHAGA